MGKHRGALQSVRPDDMAALLIMDALERHPALAACVNEVVFGAANQAGEDNRNLARMAALLAGLPKEVPAVTVNRLCGSGLEAVCDAVRRVWTGDAEVVLAGGAESMTRAPYVMPKSAEAFARSAPPIFDTALGWRLANPKMASIVPLESMGETAENMAKKWNIGREEQDAFALASHQKATRALRAGAFDAEVVPVSVASAKGADSQVAQDENPRAELTTEALAKLKPVFAKDGTVTAGNSSPLSDGASLLAVCSERGLKQAGLTPIARVVSFATAGVDPSYMGEGPIPAGKKALSRAGWAANEVDLFELNEAFAVQALACMRGLELDPAKVNVNGGAIALGHPIGSSGCRVLVTLLHAMQQQQKKRGMAALCIGVGQGIAMTVEQP
jgi:acetyl-CoA acetyltransferase family protein